MVRPDVDPRPRGGRAWLILAIVLATLLLVVASVAALFVLRYRLLSAAVTLDARTAFVAPADPGSLAEAAPVVRARLRSLYVPARVSVEGPRLVVEHRAADAEVVRAVARPRGELRFMLVAEGLPAAEVEAIVARVTAARARGGLSPDERYDCALQDGRPLVLERPGVGGPGTLAGARRALGADGRPAVGFELTEAAGREFFTLTSNSVGRRLAIVLDGEVNSSPVIRSAIGRRGVIEGGAAGWTDTDVERLVSILGTDALPASLVPEAEAGR